jgi:hypothetical protein
LNMRRSLSSIYHLRQNLRSLIAPPPHIMGLCIRTILTINRNSFSKLY